MKTYAVVILFIHERFFTFVLLGMAGAISKLLNANVAKKTRILSGSKSAATKRAEKHEKTSIAVCIVISHEKWTYLNVLLLSVPSSAR